MNKSTMSLEISVNQTAAVCGRFYGRAAQTPQFHRQDYRRKNLIRLVTKRDAAKTRFRCFVRKRAICWWPNAAKSSKARPTNDHSRAHCRHDGRAADRQRRGGSFG